MQDLSVAVWKQTIQRWPPLFRLIYTWESCSGQASYRLNEKREQKSREQSSFSKCFTLVTFWSTNKHAHTSAQACRKVSHCRITCECSQSLFRNNMQIDALNLKKMPITLFTCSALTETCHCKNMRHFQFMYLQYGKHSAKASVG